MQSFIKILTENVSKKAGANVPEESVKKALSTILNFLFIVFCIVFFVVCFSYYWITKNNIAL